MEILEILVPVVLFVVMALANAFHNKNEANDGPSPQAEELERRREELRRKIRERSEQSKETTAPASREQQPQPQPQEQRPRQPAYSDPETRSYQESRRQQDYESAQRQQGPQRPVSSGTGSLEEIQRRIREQQRRVEESERQRSAAMDQARAVEDKAAARRKRRESAKAAIPTIQETLTLQDQLKAELRSDRGLRKAFLFSEVVGRPVSLRRAGEHNSLLYEN